jgi:hypothetical protein
MLDIDLISELPHTPPPQMCVGICVARRGRKRFIASWGPQPHAPCTSCLKVSFCPPLCRTAPGEAYPWLVVDLGRPHRVTTVWVVTSNATITNLDVRVGNATSSNFLTDTMNTENTRQYIHFSITGNNLSYYFDYFI